MTLPLDPEYVSQKIFCHTECITENILSYESKNTMVLIDSIHNIDICMYFVLYVNRIKAVSWHHTVVFLDDICDYLG